MSNYESMSGSAKLKGADFAKLRKELIVAFNKDIEPIKKKHLGELKKAHSRTYSFEIIEPTMFHGHTELKPSYHGKLTLNKEDNTLRFHIPENNHAVDHALGTNLMKVVMRFFESMEQKGKIYGAETVYSSEYHHDGGYSDPDVMQYGAWIEPKRARRRKY